MGVSRELESRGREDGKRILGPLLVEWPPLLCLPTQAQVREVMASPTFSFALWLPHCAVSPPLPLHSTPLGYPARVQVWASDWDSE